LSNIREVAQRAGVSTTTVSHVINNTRFVSSDVRARVEDAIRETNYQPNALARSLRRGKSHTIGLILPDSGNPFFAEIGRAVEGEAFARGYSVIFCNTESNPDREDFYLELLASKRVDGIILVSGGLPTQSFIQVDTQKTPVVAVDRDSSDLAIDTVLTDNLGGGMLATRHLIELGHKRIACLMGPSSISPSAQRLNGYRQALQEAGLPFDECLVRQGDYLAGSGWTIGRELLTVADRPSAIFACNDMMAIGVLRAAAELGFDVPRDLALVGFDDIELAAYTHPPLTTVAQDKQKIGEIAVSLLVEKIGDQEMNGRREFLQPRLVIRKSCGSELHR
jgi:LacI family transcriptional regulator